LREKNWNELKHVLVHVIVHGKKSISSEISASLGIYIILCWSSDAPPSSVLQKFKFLASSIVQVSMSSSTRWDAVSVSFQVDTYIAAVLAGVTLSVNAFECWHARGPSPLARLAKDLCACIAGLRGTDHFCLWAALFWTTKQYIQVYWDESLSKSQSESAEEKPLVHNSRLSETNVKD